MLGILNGIDFISRGGLMMIPLLISALVALTVIIERLFLLQRHYKIPSDQWAKVRVLLNSRQIQQAKEICQTKQTPLTSVILTGIHHFGSSPAQMELSMKNQAEAWVPRLEKRIEILDTIITAAPLMGLLGTITGMMGSFQILSEKGINEPNAITGGVAEALIATATGLIIALICLIAYNYLNALIKSYIYEVESAASLLLEIRLTHHEN
jgi:biopolymer transport protein ExbB